MWIPLILGSAAVLGVYDVCKKHAVADNAVMPVLFWATLSGSACYLLLLGLTGGLSPFPWCDARFHLLVASKTLLVAGSWVATYRALRDLPISIVTPIRASSPFWVCLGGVVIYREIPTPIQAAGMALILTGYYLFSVAGRLEGISFRRHRGIHLVFLGTFLGACAGLFDKYLLGKLRLPKDGFQLWFSIDMVAVLGLGWLIARLGSRGQERRPLQWRWSIPLTGVLLIAADWLYFYSLSFPEARISLVALLRRCSVIVSFAVGSLFFHDVNLKRKTAALAVILFGVALLVAFR